MIDAEKLVQNALALQQSGRLPEAEAQLWRALESSPNYVPALGNLGTLLQQQGRVPEAAECFRRICLLEPANAQAFIFFGVCLGILRKLPEAVAIFREAARIAPALPVVQGNLAQALFEMGDYKEAEEACRAAISLQPGDAASLSKLAAILNGQNRYEEAITAAQSALSAKPDLPEGHYQLGIALRGVRRMSEALDAVRRAVELRPDYADAQGALAMLLAGFGQATEAAAVIEKALAAAPNNADLQNVAGLVLRKQGRVEEAIVHYRRASELNLHNWVAGSSLLFALHNIDELDPRTIYREHVAWAERHARPLQERLSFVHANSREEDRPLRIAYISPDFRYHSVAHFLRPIIAHHDRAQFQIACYSGVEVPDGWTESFKAMGVVWRDTSRWVDGHVAEQINADVIDIAIDCSGHTAANRLLALAPRPAPVQVTFLGYPDTTGMESIDYRITDALADPLGEADRLHIERLIRLNPTAWCYAAAADAPACIAERGAGPIRFGSFTALPKLTPRWAGVWSKILHAVPDSRLLLKTAATQDPGVRQRVLAMFTSHGLPENRIELLPRQRLPGDHLAMYNRVDIALDTFPYHGTTTTCEAMYMGVPMVTCAGRIHASRVGVSLLSAVGLNELIATDEDQFVDLAVRLASDSARLRELHATLRRRMETSPLMDAPAYVAGLERAYREIWRTWCRSGAVKNQ